ncbi:MAG: hypothetical protein Q4C65_10390, partial [Eubacteriales bacterium]|nr:hypothetical protein [Eubacteriales bacterium]
PPEHTTTEDPTTEETTTEETTTEEATETLPPNRLPMGADQQRGREPLESVVKEMYTTLYDMDHRIVDTNDPQYEKDSMYVPEEEGGEGATVDLGEGLYVRFRMADILEHEDGDGVQEGTVYYMSLPEELVPQAEDEEGNRLVDPDEPLTFIDNGMISARGGIYTADGGYELQVAFFDVEDKIDISGEFQYAVSVDESLEPGKEYELTYVPGGHDKRMSK